MTLILASQSEIRLKLLRSAGVAVEAQPARVDEQAIREALEAEGTPPRDIADALAEAKALRVSARDASAIVLGCDQVLDLDGRVLAKPGSPDEAVAHLQAMAGRPHHLYSACVAYEAGQPVWRHVGTVRLDMRPLSDSFIAGYVARNWHSVQHSVGAYKIEEEGVRLFRAIEGSHFDVLGLPLIPLLSWLDLRGYLLA